jgi:outer membrane protein OmpA-like peptidoglycan-associated protein
LYRGGGLELWRELYEPFNIIPFPVGNTGPAMGGWFNKKIERIFDLKGLKIRIAGLGGKVYREARADTVLLPANKILSAFEKKSIDAAVFQGPFHDQWLGLDKCNTKYYYYPGWHEPGTIIELIVNKQAWEGLPEHIKETIKSVAGKSYNEIYTQFERMNFERMKQIQEQREVELKKFPDTVIEEFKQLTRRVLEDEAKNKQFKAIYDAYKKFEDSNEKWKGISIVKIKNRSTEIVITKFINEVGFSKNLAIQQEGENSAVISLIGEASFARARKFNEPTDKQSSEIKSIAEIVNNNNLFIKTIRVVDYTYDKKNKFKNLKLSMKRADAIKKLLIDKGVAASLIKVNPLGESAGDSKSENKIEIIVEFKED